MPKAPIRYDPTVHIRPMEHNRYCGALDGADDNIREFIANQIGEDRFEELDELDIDGQDVTLREAVDRIREEIAGLFKLPQDRYEYYPYNLGKGGDDHNPINFYHPDDPEKCLGRMLE